MPIQPKKVQHFNWQTKTKSHCQKQSWRTASTLESTSRVTVWWFWTKRIFEGSSSSWKILQNESDWIEAKTKRENSFCRAIVDQAWDANMNQNPSTAQFHGMPVVPEPELWFRSRSIWIHLRAQIESRQLLTCKWARREPAQGMHFKGRWTSWNWKYKYWA